VVGREYSVGGTWKRLATTRACRGSLAPEKRLPIAFLGSLAGGGWLHESGLAQHEMQASKLMFLASRQPGPAIRRQPNASKMTILGLTRMD
jgi:hypothetical protein